MRNISYYIYLTLVYPLALMPLRILYVLSDILYMLFYKLLHYRVEVTRKNLAASFPQYSGNELLDIEKAFYRHFCDNIVETIKLLHISDKEIYKRIHVFNSELIESIAAHNKPIIIYLGHYGNWEWVPAVTWHFKNPEYCGQIYRPLHDKGFDKLMLRVRSRFGTESIPQQSAFRHLIRLKKSGKPFLIGFIADQRPNGKNLNHWMTFLGQETAYNVGGEEIGRHLEAAYVYLDVVKTRRGYYDMTFREIVPADKECSFPFTKEYMKMLEQSILNEPQYWLWTHKRWVIPGYSKCKK